MGFQDEANKIIVKEKLTFQVTINKITELVVDLEAQSKFVDELDGYRESYKKSISPNDTVKERVHEILCRLEVKLTRIEKQLHVIEGALAHDGLEYLENTENKKHSVVAQKVMGAHAVIEKIRNNIEHSLKYYQNHTEEFFKDVNGYSFYSLQGYISNFQKLIAYLTVESLGWYLERINLANMYLKSHAKEYSKLLGTKINTVLRDKKYKINVFVEINESVKELQTSFVTLKHFQDVHSTEDYYTEIKVNWVVLKFQLRVNNSNSAYDRTLSMYYDTDKDNFGCSSEIGFRRFNVEEPDILISLFCEDLKKTISTFKGETNVERARLWLKTYFEHCIEEINPVQ